MCVFTGGPSVGDGDYGARLVPLQDHPRHRHPLRGHPGPRRVGGSPGERARVIS